MAITVGEIIRTGTVAGLRAGSPLSDVAAVPDCPAAFGKDRWPPKKIRPGDVAPRLYRFNRIQLASREVVTAVAPRPNRLGRVGSVE